MLPEVGVRRRKVRLYRTAVDGQLLEKTGLDELTLYRVRKALMVEYGRLSWGSRERLLRAGTYVRFQFLSQLVQRSLPPDAWQRWLRYLEHTEQDLTEMGRGEYPLSPYLIRLYSALFGIKVDFLLGGHPPTAEPRGVSIDLWPLTGTAR